MNVARNATRARTSDVAVKSVYELTKLFAEASNPQAILPRMLGMLASELALSAVAIVLDGESTVFDSLGGEQQVLSELSPRWSSILRDALARATRTRMPWIVESEFSESALGDGAPPSEYPYLDRSFVSVPIKDDGRVSGVLGSERMHGPGDQAGFYFDADVRLLTVVANMIATERSARRPQEPAGSSEREALPPPRRPPLPPVGPTTLASGLSVLGSSPRWRATLERARAAARSTSTVVLRGESGTGKEILAHYIYEQSQRSTRPFVTVNCAALSETVLESELFGHEKGAFTGAASQRKGRFELADGGTLFLDEIGEISPAFQARLLRVLQLGEFERVGGMTTLKVDVRLIAATNRDLEQEVRSGRFRADLYYRINVVPVLVPALRERSPDIPDLAREFLKRVNQSNGTSLTLGPSALVAYEFPGNARELENCVRRAASLARGPQLTAEDFAWLKEETPLTHAFRESRHSTPPAMIEAPPRPAEPGLSDAPPPSEHPQRLRTIEGGRERLIAALEQAGWVQAKAARLLGVTPRQIAYALQKYQIRVRRF